MASSLERNDLAAALLVTEIENSLSKDGIAVVQRSGQADFEAAHARLTENSGVSPPLNKKFVDIDPSDMFWVEASIEGQVISVQAMRRETISISLRRHLEQQYRRLYCDPVGSSIEGQAPGANNITGTIAYHGDLVVGEMCRRKGIGSRLSNLTILLAHVRWNPNYVWGFVENRKVLSGYAQRVGYWNSEPFGTWYSSAPSRIREDDWLVWLSRDQLNYRIQLSQRHTTRPEQTRSLQRE